MIKLSIIIPAFNEEKLLPRTIDGVFSAAQVFDEAGVNWECIVCDNNSTDKTSEIAKSRGCQVVFEPINQIARSRNTGASVAKGEWYLFMDADSTPSQGLFSDLLAAISRSDVAGGGARISMDEHLHWFWRIWVRMWNFVSMWFSFAAGSFVYCRSDYFEEIGGFPEDHFAGEEIKFSQDLKRLAKRRGQKAVILTRHPLVTSSRKVHLYSRKELGMTFLRALFFHKRFKQKKSDCHLWYDGRR